jgi:hypothetical protein
VSDSLADHPLDSGRSQPRLAPWSSEDVTPAQATAESRPLDLPDRRVFWGWVWENVRPVVGWVLAGLGALALLLGWYGVSGQALTAKQLPYLVSGGLVGIALIVMAGVFLATEDFRRQVTRLSVLERKVDDLLALLTTDDPVDLLPPAPGELADGRSAAGRPSVARTATEALLALPTGTVYHRPECALIVGKPAAVPVGAATIAGRHLAPCRVCDPPPPAA